MKKIIFLSCIYFFSEYSSAALKEKYPRNILTEDFGILSEKDIQTDINMYSKPTPYEKNNGFGAVWQCFQTSKAKIFYRKWNGNDGMDVSTKLFQMCDLEITIFDSSIKHTYGDRKARRIEFCQEVVSEWKKISNNMESICINGESLPESTSEFSKSWILNKFKSKSGCYSIWNNVCS